MNTLERFEHPSLVQDQYSVPLPVAVIGIGCRFPGGIDSPESYWKFLAEKSCGIVQWPADRWNLDAYYDSDPDAAGKSRSKWGGFLQGDVFGFDPAFFDMSPREAMAMDPQQRLLLQIAYETVQDAGTTIEALQRIRTGVFVGISSTDFAFIQKHRGGSPGIFAGTGSAMSIAANRISHRFDFNGPSLAIDTACSSALVAVDQAIRHLSMDSCDVAFAGGVNCLLEPATFVAFSGANMISPTGAIYTFDERADGFLRAEGCGFVLLKPLVRAIKDGDRIYAVIRGSAVNQDGRTPTLTAPSDEAQTAMLGNLVSKASIEPGDVGFIEAHGTGTPVGDPIEARSIGRVFGRHRSNGPIPVGSFKPNIGHVEAASGVAGLIKIVLSTNRGIVLPNLNFARPNPNIPFDLLGIKVPVEPEPFDDRPGASLAIVNSFGFGGTNACVAVESWRGPPSPLSYSAKRTAIGASPVFVPISAGSKAALGAWALHLADALDAGGALENVAYEQVAAHLKCQRDHFAERAVILAEPEHGDLPAKLRGFARKEDILAKDSQPTIIAGRAAKKRKLAVTFSGQGGQWWAMGRRLLLEEPLYRRTVDIFDEVFRAIAGWSAVEEMLRPQDQSRINDPDTTQAAIFANQIGLFALWKARGVTPELFVGHSFGEVAATYLAGAIDLETAARIIYHRGYIPDQSTRRGAMAAIGLTVDQLLPMLPGDDSVVIAAYNGPTAQTISGMEEAVDTLLAEVGRRHPDALARRHTMNFGWHSAHLEDCEAWFRTKVGEIAWKPPQIPIVSTVTGVFETRFDAEYWWQNLRQPVSFKKAIDLCLDLGIDAFLELGPHRTVTPLVHGIAQERATPVIAVTSLDRTADDFWTQARSMASLHVAGVNFDWSRSDQIDKGIKLPTIPWANERLVQLPHEAKMLLFEGERHPLLGWRELAPEPTWTNEISLKNFRYLSDHRVGGDCLFPTVGYVEVMVAALRDHFSAGPVELRDLKILEALSIGDDDSIILRTTFDPVTHRLRISSLHRNSDEGWRLRAQAYGWQHEFTLQGRSFDPAVLETPPTLERDEFYKLFSLHGLEHSKTFRAVEQLWIVSDERSICRVHSPEAERRRGFVAFPGLLDSVLQSAIPLSDMLAGIWKPGEPLPEPGKQSAQFQFRLPVGIRKVMIAGPLPPTVITEFHISRQDGSGTYCAYAPDGTPLLAVENLYTKALGAGRNQSNLDAGAASIYEEHFVRVGNSDATDSGKAARLGNWLLISGNAEATRALSVALECRGATVRTFDPAPLVRMETDFATAAIEGLCNEGDGLSGIIFALGADAGCEDEARLTTRALSSAVEDTSVALITLGQVLDKMRAAQVRPSLTVLTRGSRRVPGDASMSIAGLIDSALIGLTRTIASECPEFTIRQLDTDEAASFDATALAAAVLEESPETEIIVRGQVRYVPRLEQKSLAALAPRKRRVVTARDNSNYKVTMTAPGTIDNIIVREAATPEPGPGEVIVELAAAGLNFRDVMVATGLLPDEVEGENALWRNLGYEFAGTVRAVGEAVDGLKIGDRVAGMGTGFLRRYARMAAEFVIRVPDGTDLIAAATMPVAFTTAHYALETVGHLARGEKVLIHLASGGVGLAAIQVARHIGAEIFATAGSDRKRAYLRDLGIAEVMSSRNLDFAEEVRAKTGGRGVDVVLNALSGAAIDKGLECLAPYGRFVEIGKRDLADDKPIGLKSLYCNNSYSVIDLSTFGQQRRGLLRRLMDEVAERFASGVYRPLAFTSFPVSQVADAMRMLAKAQHIGKVLVTFDEAEVEVELDLERPLALSRQASYLVTGGLRGFGVAVADFLSQRGAGRLVLAGRGGQVDPAAQPTIDAILARGTEIVPAAVDVTDSDAVATLVAEHVKSEKPLRGIIHGAAVIEDGMLSQLDRGRIERVIRPKAAGAWNLHRAVSRAQAELDFFVSFSSLAQMIGSIGQANYTAANSVLDATASFRRSRGLPGSAIGWGAIGGSGFVARSEAMGRYLDSIGMKTVADTEAAAALDPLLRADSEKSTFAGVDWSMVGRIIPAAASNPRLKPLLVDRAGGRSRIRAELTAVPRTDWEPILARLIRGEVARVLKVDASAIPFDRKLSELGLDSLSSFELKNRIEAQIEISIPVAKFLQAPTVNGLSGVIANAFEATLKAQAAAQAASRENESAGPGAAKSNQPFVPLTRQIAAAELAGRPMTSAVACADCEIAADIYCDGALGVEQLADALAGLAEVQEALRLTMTKSTEGRIELTLGGAPTLHFLETDDDLPASASDSLWRFGAARVNGNLHLRARAHRAAADALSPLSVLGALATSAKTGKITPPQTAFSTFTRANHSSEGSPQHVRNSAFWREALRSVPPVLPQPRRTRAPAPTGLGMNRGPVGCLETRVIAPEIAGFDPDAQESMLLAAFCRALSRVHRTAAIVVERHDDARRDAGPFDLIGPIADCFPIVLDDLAPPFRGTVERVRRALALGRAHRAMDTAAIEGLLERELRERNAALRQFGFCFLDTESARRMTALGFADPLTALSHSSNEVRADVSVSENGVRLRLSIDTDVADRKYAEALVAEFAEELRLCMRDESSSPVSATESLLWSDPRSQQGDKASPTAAAQPASLPVVATPPKRDLTREIPISSVQDDLLRGVLRPDASVSYKTYWSVGRAFCIKPHIDVMRLQRAVATLTERHEALRTRFTVGEDGAIRAFLEPRGESCFRVEDMAGKDEAAVLHRVAALTDHPIDPFTDPLYQITVLRWGRNGDIIHSKGHHVVGDGWSFGLLLEEMLQAYMGLALRPVEMTTEEYVRLIDKSGDPEALAKRDHYLRSLYAAPTPQLPKIGRVARGLAPNRQQVHTGEARELVAFCTSDGQQRLTKRARAAGTTETSLLIAAYAQTLAARGGVDEIIATVPVALRADRRLTNFVGNLQGHSYLRADMRDRPSLESLALRLGEQLNRSIEHVPFNNVLSNGLRQEIFDSGSYVALYCTGMLAPNPDAHGGSSASLQRFGSEEVDFGMAKISPIGTSHIVNERACVFELDVRSFQGPRGLAYRCAYDLIAFDSAQAQDIFGEVLDRLGLGNGGHAPIVGMNGGTR